MMVQEGVQKIFRKISALLLKDSSSSCLGILTYHRIVVQYIMMRGCRSSKIALVLLLLPFIVLHLKIVHGLREDRITVSHILQALRLSPSSTALRESLLETIEDLVISQQIENLKFLRITRREKLRELCLLCSKKYVGGDILMFPKCRFGNHVLILKVDGNDFVCSTCRRKYTFEELKRLKYPFCKKCGGPLTREAQRTVVVSFSDDVVNSSKIIEDFLEIVSRRCSFCIRLDNMGGGDF